MLLPANPSRVITHEEVDTAILKTAKDNVPMIDVGGATAQQVVGFNPYYLRVPGQYIVQDLQPFRAHKDDMDVLGTTSLRRDSSRGRATTISATSPATGRMQRLLRFFKMYLDGDS